MAIKDKQRLAGGSGNESANLRNNTGFDVMPSNTAMDQMNNSSFTAKPSIGSTSSNGKLIPQLTEGLGKIFNSVANSTERAYRGNPQNKVGMPEKVVTPSVPTTSAIADKPVTSATPVTTSTPTASSAASQALLTNKGIGTTAPRSAEDVVTMNKNLAILDQGFSTSDGTQVQSEKLQRSYDNASRDSFNQQHGLSSEVKPSMIQPQGSSGRVYNDSNYKPSMGSGSLGTFQTAPRGEELPMQQNYAPPQRDYSSPEIGQTQEGGDMQLRGKYADMLDRESRKNFKNTGLIKALIEGINGIDSINAGDRGIASGERRASGELANSAKLGADKMASDEYQNSMLVNARGKAIGQSHSALQESLASDRKSQLVMKNLLARKDLSPREKWSGLVQDLNGDAPSLDHLKGVFSPDHYDSLMSKDDAGFVQDLKESNIPDVYGANFLAERRAQFKN